VRTVTTALALLTTLAGTGILAAWWVRHHVTLWRTFPWRMRRAMVHLGLVRRIAGRRDEKPRLVRNEPDGDAMHLAWRMPAGANTKFDGAKRELELTLDCAIRSWHADGRLHTLIGRAPIPDMHLLSEAPRAIVGALPVHLGMGRFGPINIDLAEAPHMLVGGTSGAGKTAEIESILLQLCRAKSPAELELVLVDLKGGVDMALFVPVPHRRAPVAGNHEGAAERLTDLVAEMEARQAKILGRATTVGEWNRIHPEDRIAYVVCVIDEFADLLPKDAATKRERDAREAAWAAVSTLTRMGRASGIHLIIATQRPDADVLQGQVKANTPIHIAFSCASDWNSIVMLGQGNTAAFRLPCLPNGKPLPGRAIFQWAGSYETPFQAAYMEPAEIEAEVHALRARYAPHAGLSASDAELVPVLPNGEKP